MAAAAAGVDAEAAPATSGSDSELELSGGDEDGSMAASDTNGRPLTSRRDSGSVNGPRPDTQDDRSMPRWREPTWGASRVNSREPTTAPRSSPDDLRATLSASSNGASAGPLVRRRSVPREIERSPGYQEPAQEGAARVPFARRASQNSAQAEAARDQGWYGQAGSPPQQGPRTDQGLKRRLLEDGVHRKQSLGELAGTAAERQPPRRNPGGPPKWEERLASTSETGVPLLYVLPEDEQQGAEVEVTVTCISATLHCAVAFVLIFLC